jgi:hypothetical protein
MQTFTKFKIMKSIIYVVIAYLFGGLEVYAKPSGGQTLRGCVTDKDVKQAVVYANVILVRSG